MALEQERNKQRDKKVQDHKEKIKFMISVSQLRQVKTFAL
jgi:hypothetical protein